MSWTPSALIFSLSSERASIDSAFATRGQLFSLAIFAISFAVSAFAEASSGELSPHRSTDAAIDSADSVTRIRARLLSSFVVAAAWVKLSAEPLSLTTAIASTDNLVPTRSNCSEFMDSIRFFKSSPASLSETVTATTVGL